MHPATILAQLDGFEDPAGALVPALQLAVSSRLPGAEVANHYARSGNSAAGLVERVMTGLDAGAVAAAFTSAAAITQAVLSTLRPGDHVIYDIGTYYEFAAGIREFGARWGIDAEGVDLTDPEAARGAVRPGRTRLVWAECPIWAECPTNPMWRVKDIRGLVDVVHAPGAVLLVDATVATPILCRPLTLGADLVLHSATKYLNGHGDILAGVLVGARDDPAWTAILEARTRGGSILPPFESWLLLRGLRTLAVRMERVSASALQIATALAADRAVTAVHYPGLPGDPWHGAAAAQFSTGFGGMLSFQTGVSAARAIAVCSATRLFRRATSLGSTESLIEHRLTTEGPTSTCPPGLIRLSVGLEHPDDLIADLAEALRS